MSNTMSDDTIQNRNELIALFDAINANPNGVPMSGENRPELIRTLGNVSSLTFA